MINKTVHCVLCQNVNECCQVLKSFVEYERNVSSTRNALLSMYVECVNNCVGQPGLWACNMMNWQLVCSMCMNCTKINHLTALVVLYISESGLLSDVSFCTLQSQVCCLMLRMSCVWTLLDLARSCLLTFQNHQRMTRHSTHCWRLVFVSSVYTEWVCTPACERPFSAAIQWLKAELGVSDTYWWIKRCGRTKAI